VWKSKIKQREKEVLFHVKTFIADLKYASEDTTDLLLIKEEMDNFDLDSALKKCKTLTGLVKLWPHHLLPSFIPFSDAL